MWKNFTVKMMTGFESELKFLGRFNSVPNIVFNFAIPNSNIAPVLYPAGTFNMIEFFNETLGKEMTGNMTDLWAFIFNLLEGRTIRQTSKIFDYGRYVISEDYIKHIFNYSDTAVNFESFITHKYQQGLNDLMRHFHTLAKVITERQAKVLVSYTTFPS